MAKGFRLGMRGLGLIALLGGLGGVISANSMVTRPGATWSLHSWLLLPAGVWYGALLAVLAVGSSRLLSRCSLPLMLIGIPIAGWVAGWLSSIPLKLYVLYQSQISQKFFPLPRPEGSSYHLQINEWGVSTFVEEFFWPFRFWISDELAMPFLFGLVVMVWVGLVALIERRVVPRVPWVVVGVISGMLGSAWWSSFWSPLQLSLFYGAIWGALVGFGVWKAQRLGERSQV